MVKFIFLTFIAIGLKRAVAGQQDVTLRVTTVLNEPYVMLKPNAAQLPGNYKFEGFCVDLLLAVSRDTGYKFEIEEQADGRYGYYNGTDIMDEQTHRAGWNGMVGSLVSGSADLSMGDLTMTWARSKAIDFSLPYLKTGITMLTAKETLPNPGLFWFLDPFSVTAWVCILLTYLSLSVLSWLMTSKVPAGQDSTANQLICGLWWIFTLVVFATYTAILAARSTHTEEPISDVHQLALQKSVRIGTVKGGSTYNFFRQSDKAVIQRLWRTMDSDSNNYMPSVKAGVQRVLKEKGNYVFMMEGLAVEYLKNRHCELAQIGTVLDDRAYAFGLPKDSPHRAMINQALLKLQENGDVQAIKDKWWKGSNGGCANDTNSDAMGSIGIEGIGGVLILIGAGKLLALIVAALEMRFRPRLTKKNIQDLGLGSSI